MSYQFKPTWLITSIFTVLITGLISLGLWQYARATEKHALQLMIDDRALQAPLSLNMPFEEFSPFQLVEATGTFIHKDSILLDNIVYKGKPGYYLISPFRILATRSIILVNRGWLPQGPRREVLPTFETPLEVLTLRGHLTHPRSKPVLTGGISTPLSATPPLWHYMDLNFFSQLQGYSVLPLVMNLNQDGQEDTLRALPLNETTTKFSLIRDWPAYDAKSGMHIGYAIQWFVFALFAFVAYLGISFKKITKEIT